jgi:lysophospholipase L1-like esterase
LASAIQKNGHRPYPIPNRYSNQKPMMNRLFALLLTLLSITAFSQTENWNYPTVTTVDTNSKVKIYIGGTTKLAKVTKLPGETGGGGGGSGIDWTSLGIRTFKASKDSVLVYFNGLFYRTKIKIASSSDTGLLTKEHWSLFNSKYGSGTAVGGDLVGTLPNPTVNWVNGNTTNDSRYNQKANNLSDVANAATARNNILPAQSGNTGKSLVTDGANVSWQTVSSGGVPTTRNVSTTSPLQGGGPLSSDLTLSVLDASSSQKGVLKLIPSVGGTATDGAPDQNSVNVALAGKVATTDATYVKSVVLNTPNVVFSTPINFTTASNTATGTLALNSQTAGYSFIAPQFSNGTPSFRQIQNSDVNLQKLGTLYSVTNWTGLSGSYNTSGSSGFTFGTTLSTSSSTFSYTNKITYSAYGNTALEKWSRKSKFTVGTITSTSYGVSFGVKSASIYPQSLDYYIGTASGNLGQIGFIFNESASAPSYNTSGYGSAFTSLTAGDVVEVVATMDFNVLTVYAKNLTTGEAISSTFDYGVATNPQPPNYGAFSIGLYGGTNQVTSDILTSDMIVGGNVLVIGDSITFLYTVTSPLARWISLAKIKYAGVIQAYAKGGSRIEDVNYTEIGLLRPKKIVLAIGTNNKGNGDNAATFGTKYTSALSSLSALGYSVANGNLILCTYCPRNDFDMTDFNAVVVSNAGSSNVIDFFKKLKAQSGTGFNTIYNSGDGVHPNNAGHAAMLNEVERSNGAALFTFKYDLSGSTNQFPTIQVGTSYPNYAKTTITDATGATQLSITKSGLQEGASIGSVNASNAYILAGARSDGTNNIALTTTASGFYLNGATFGLWTNSGLSVGATIASNTVFAGGTSGVGTLKIATGLQAGTATNRYPIDAIGTDGTSARFSNSDADFGGYIGSISAGNVYHSAGKAYSAAAGGYVIKNSSNSNFLMNNGQFVWESDQGSTVGSTQTSPTSRMVLTTTGSLGIGTTSPLSKLHVVGGARIDSLGGGGIQMVTVNNQGYLGKQAIPSGTGTGISTFTSTGSSGAATWNSGTGTLNIPNYTLAGLGGFTNPMTTTGDMIYSSSVSTPARLGIGSTGQVMQVLSGVPIWTTDIIGVSGGRFVYGGTGNGDNLSLGSTSASTRGKIYFGQGSTTYFDETNSKWTIAGRITQGSDLGQGFSDRDFLDRGNNDIRYLSNERKLSTTTGINAKSATSTTLYTVPTGKTLVITKYIVRCTAATAITTGMSASLTSTGSYASAFFGFSSLTDLGMFMKDDTGTGPRYVMNAGETVSFAINTAASGTSQTVAVDLFGYEY